MSILQMFYPAFIREAIYPVPHQSMNHITHRNAENADHIAHLSHIYINLRGWKLDMWSLQNQLGLHYRSSHRRTRCGRIVFRRYGDAPVLCQPFTTTNISWSWDGCDVYRWRGRSCAWRSYHPKSRMEMVLLDISSIRGHCYGLDPDCEDSRADS